jgi:hypothetical protein
LLIICTQLHSLNLTCLVAGVLHRKAHHGTKLKTWLFARASCANTYNTPLGFEGRNVVINGSLLCNSGQHSHNTCQGYLELDTSCFQP